MSDSVVAGPVDHVAISVADLEGMTEWYKRALGLEEDIADRMAIPEQGVRGSLLMGPRGFRLEILSRPDSTRRDPPHTDTIEALRDQGYHHWGFLVADLDAALARLQAAGATLVHRKAELASHNALFAIVADPEGNMIEPIQPVAGDPDAAGAWSRLRYHQAVHGLD